MTNEEAIKALDAIEDGDEEQSHKDADKILLAVVPTTVQLAYNAAIKRTGPWWYA